MNLYYCSAGHLWYYYNNKVVYYKSLNDASHQESESADDKDCGCVRGTKTSYIKFTPVMKGSDLGEDTEKDSTL